MNPSRVPPAEHPGPDRPRPDRPGPDRPRPDHGRPDLDPAEAPTLPAWRHLYQRLSWIDRLIFGYLGYMTARALLARPGPDTDRARLAFGLAFAGVGLALYLVRWPVLPAGVVRTLVHRLAHFTGVLGSYFWLREALHCTDPVLLDAPLAAIDRAVFGAVPSQWLEQFATPAVTEWFAFFYYSYFTILALALVPAGLGGRSTRPFQLVFGILYLICVGHMVYTLVPGLGPYATLEFKGPLEGGVFLGLVMETVFGSGALLDIFPSLHTAVPAYIAVHCFRFRHHRPERYLWPVVAFFSANIIVATLLLRWHYGIDVIVGLLHCAGAVWWARRLDRDEQRRAAVGLPPMLD